MVFYGTELRKFNFNISIGAHQFILVFRTHFACPKRLNNIGNKNIIMVLGILEDKILTLA